MFIGTLKGTWKKALLKIAVFLSLFTSNVPFAEDTSLEVLRKLNHYIQIKSYITAKEEAEKIYKTAKSLESKEVAFLIYWEAKAFLDYKKGQFDKILEDIGSLNLYWSFFEEPKHEYLYYDILGKLYTLLFQFRRAVGFFIESYKIKPRLKEFLNIILATELAYYNELRPYYNYKVLNKLINKVDPNKLGYFDKSIFFFEKGLYYLLIGNYKQAYKYFVQAYKLNLVFLREPIVNFFMGKTLEGLGKLKDAYLYYKLALKQAKHPIIVQNILFRLFIVSAKLGYYQEANDYYYGLAQFGGLETNIYLQEASLKIANIPNFLPYFYWKDYYNDILAKIMWLNLNKDRGKLAFLYLLKNFLYKGIWNDELLIAWKVLYPNDLAGYTINPKQLLVINTFKVLEKLNLLYKANPDLFVYFFKDYGYLALAKFYFLKGEWDKTLEFLSKVKLKSFWKFYLKGVIEAYKGKPFLLENIYSSLPVTLKIKSLFWLGWGYLLNNRWDLVSLYWEEFLKKSPNVEGFYTPRLIAAIHLAFHYQKLGLLEKAHKYYKVSLDLLKGNKDLQGLKRYLALKLVQLGNYQEALKYTTIFEDKNWQLLLKYLQGG